MLPRGRRVSRTTTARLNPWYQCSRMVPEGTGGTLNFANGSIPPCFYGANRFVAKPCTQVTRIS
jgi:hypothetical protein